MLHFSLITLIAAITLAMGAEAAVASSLTVDSLEPRVSVTERVTFPRNVKAPVVDLICVTTDGSHRILTDEEGTPTDRITFALPAEPAHCHSHLYSQRRDGSRALLAQTNFDAP